MCPTTGKEPQESRETTFNSGWKEFIMNKVQEQDFISGITMSLKIYGALTSHFICLTTFPSMKNKSSR